jgi:ABC-type dipeptide/oligopeptide/nickel transport system permease subunit
VEERKPFELKPWMWVALLVALLLVVFNFDPIGDGLEKIFGQGTDRWAINIVLIAIIIYAFVKKK